MEFLVPQILKKILFLLKLVYKHVSKLYLFLNELS